LAPFTLLAIKVGKMLSIFFGKIQKFFRNRLPGPITAFSRHIFLRFFGLELRQGFNDGCFRPVSALRGAERSTRCAERVAGYFRFAGTATPSCLGDV
jgi:hypothetical protein